MKIQWLMFCGMLAAGCVLNHPDHFYALSAGHSEQPPRASFAMQVNLRISLPIMVERSEMVLSNPDGATILEHERWAAPLPEQFSSILGQDIETRRQDVIIASRGVAQPDGPTTELNVPPPISKLIRSRTFRRSPFGSRL